MKNIFLLPTDKPSKLFIDVDNNKLTITENPIGGKHFMNQNLYITSDEKIKKGNWYIADNKVYRASVDHMSELYSYPCNKIILTTDQDRIKYGVQAVDDEFLQWFVNNSSCEEVKIDFSLVSGSFKYKILIPKDKVMQRFINNAKTHSFCETPEEKCTMNYCDDNGCMNRKRDLVEPKEMLIKMMQNDEEPNIIDKWLEENGNPEIANQVELEAENYVRNHPDFETEGFSEYLNGVFNGFIEGAKWKAESSYSEQEVLNLLHRAVNDSHCSKDRVKFPSSNNCAEFVINWFKKK